jgi:hypothetical protein
LPTSRINVEHMSLHLTSGGTNPQNLGSAESEHFAILVRFVRIRFESKSQILKKDLGFCKMVLVLKI